MNIHLFGATSNSGVSFINLNKFQSDKYKIFSYSSRNKKHSYSNLKNFEKFHLLEKESPSIIVSFAPIWFLSECIEKAHRKNPKIFSNVKGLIICSSSSSVTKRFAANDFDKYLSKKLTNSEKKILDFAIALKKKCLIIQPTLIYGSINTLFLELISFVK